MGFFDFLTRKKAQPAPAKKTGPGAAPAATPASREGLKATAGAAGFAEGSRMLSPRAAEAPRTRTISETIADDQYGWTAKFDVTFADNECRVVVKAKLDPQAGVTPEDVAKVEQDSRVSFAQFFDNKFRLTDRGTGKAFPMRVSVVFTDRDPHVVIKLRKGAGHDNLSNWFVASEPIVRAHELGHQLGLKDEYIDSTTTNRKDAAAPGVKQDNSLMGNFWAEGVSTASVKQRHADELAGRIGGGSGSSYTASPIPAR
jgi:hypothetical protein